MSAWTSSLAVLLAGLAVGLGACGGQSHGTTAAARTGTAATGSTTPKPSSTPTTTSASTTSTTGSATMTTAPPPPPAGTPAPPDGLRAALGYGSNDNCMSACSGAVPASLRRRLHLPSSGGCRISGGGGPVAPSPSGTVSATPYIGSAWLGARVTWTATSYDGPVLIRGRQLDGPHAVGFGVGNVPYDELQLPAGGPRQWQGVTRVRGSGCYAYQVDGAGFSTIVVFRVA